MCKWYELESGEIECVYCGKTYKKKTNPQAQMMAHSQYCHVHILTQLQCLEEKYEDGIEDIYEKERIKERICILKEKYRKYRK